MAWLLISLMFGCDNTTTPNGPVTADTATSTKNATPRSVSGTGCSGTAAAAPGPITGVKTTTSKLGTATYTFGVPVDDVAFDVELGGVDVVLGSSKDVVVSEEIRDVRTNPSDPPLADPDTYVDVVHGVLTIKSECPKGPCNSSSYTIELPSAADTVIGVVDAGGITVVDSATTTVNVETDAGGIDVSGEVDGVRIVTDAGSLSATLVGGSVVDARTDAGSVTVSGPVGDEVCATTVAGDVAVTSGTADIVHAETGAGAVQLELTSRPTTVAATTRVGGVDVEVPKGSYAVTATAGALGTVTIIGITQDPAAKATIAAETGLGSVTVTGK